MSKQKRYVTEEVSGYSCINAGKLIEAINSFAKKYDVSVDDISVDVQQEPDYYDAVLISIHLEAIV